MANHSTQSERLREFLTINPHATAPQAAHALGMKTKSCRVLACRHNLKFRRTMIWETLTETQQAWLVNEAKNMGVTVPLVIAAVITDAIIESGDLVHEPEVQHALNI